MSSSSNSASAFGALLMVLGGGLVVAGLLASAKGRPRPRALAPDDGYEGTMPVEADPSRMDRPIEEQDDEGTAGGWW